MGNVHPPARHLGDPAQVQCQHQTDCECLASGGPMLICCMFRTQRSLSCCRATCRRPASLTTSNYGGTALPAQSQRPRQTGCGQTQCLWGCWTHRQQWVALYWQQGGLEPGQASGEAPVGQTHVTGGALTCIASRGLHCRGKGQEQASVVSPQAVHACTWHSCASNTEPGGRGLPEEKPSG